MAGAAGPAAVTVTVLQFVLPALLVLAGVVYTQRQIGQASRRATAVEARKVDADAFDRARKYDQEVVAGLRAELQRARDEIAALRSTLDAERRDHDRESRELRVHVDRLERIVARLTRRLREAGLDVAAEEV